MPSASDLMTFAFCCAPCPQCEQVWTYCQCGSWARSGAMPPLGRNFPKTPWSQSGASKSSGGFRTGRRSTQIWTKLSWGSSPFEGIGRERGGSDGTLRDRLLRTSSLMRCLDGLLPSGLEIEIRSSEGHLFWKLAGRCIMPGLKLKYHLKCKSEHWSCQNHIY